MTNEQAKLAHRVWGALMTFDAEIEAVKADPKATPSIVKILENARKVFIELNDEWRKAIGHPQELSSVAVAEILRQLADRLENEARRSD